MSLNLSPLLKRDSKLSNKNNIINKNNEKNHQKNYKDKEKEKESLFEENIYRKSNEASKKFMDLIFNLTIEKLEKGKRHSLLRKVNDNTRPSISNSKSNRISISTSSFNTTVPKAETVLDKNKNENENINIKNNNNSNINLINNKPLIDRDHINANNNTIFNYDKENKNLTKKSVFVLGNNTNSDNNREFKKSLRRITHIIEQKVEEKLKIKRASIIIEKLRLEKVELEMNIIQEHIQEKNLREIKDFSKIFINIVIKNTIKNHNEKLKKYVIKIQRIFRGHFYRFVFKIERLNLEMERENKIALESMKKRKRKTLNKKTINKICNSNENKRLKDNTYSVYESSSGLVNHNKNNFKKSNLNSNSNDEGANSCFGVFFKK
jgi:hypothetical protein